MATIIIRDGKTSVSYQVRYRIDNKQKTKSFESKREANKFKKEIEAQKTLGLARNESQFTFREYADKFMKIHLLNSKTTTKKSYHYLLNSIYLYIGDVKLKDLTANRLDSLFLKFHEKYSFNTIRSSKKVINLVLASAFKKDIIPYNPIDKMDYKLVNNDKEKNKVIDDVAIKELLDYFEYKPKYKHVVQLGLMTGMRTGEILALRKENVNLQKRELSVVENYSRWREVTTPKTKNSIRKIYIHDPLKELILKIYKYNEQNKELFGSDYDELGLLVCHEDGRYISNIAVSKAFYIASDKIGKKITAHMLRHTFATKLRMVETKDVQQLMGHGSLSMTNRYQHHDNYKEETIDLLNTTFKNID